MQIIPVIDIKNGQVVKAVAGDRSSYQPIKSQLCSSSYPTDIVSALLNQAATIGTVTTLYIADLDAIESDNNNYDVINDLAKKFPHLRLWVDAGFKTKKELDHWKRIPGLTPVIGSESHTSLTSVLPLLDADIILSLDFKNHQFLGPTELLESNRLWPNNIIVMMLDIVGGNTGPDHHLLDQIFQLANSTDKNPRLFAAGGVRHFQDLIDLKNRGIQGALIASALHNQRLSSKLSEYSRTC